MIGVRLRRALTRMGELATRPGAFAVVAAYALAWLIFSPATFGWGAIASLATWLMTLFIPPDDGVAITFCCLGHGFDGR